MAGTGRTARLSLFIGLLAVAVAAAHALVQIELVDEGVLDMGAWRIVEGQVPYRDFFAFYTPVSFYLVALAYKLFGVAVLPGRILALGLGVVLVAATARLSARFIPSPLFAALPVAVLCQAGLGIWPFASHHWLVTIFSILAVVAALRALAGHAFRWSVLAGLCAAGGIWSLNNPGLLLVLLVAALYLPRLPAALRRPALGGWGLGLLAGSLPFLLLLLVQVDARTLWYDLYVFPLTAYKSLAGNRYGITFPLQEIFRQWTSGSWRGSPVYTAAVTASALFIYVAPFAALVLVVVAYWKKWEAPARRGLLAAGTLCFLATTAWRFGPINLQWSAVFPAVVVAWALHLWHAAAPPPRRRLPAGIALLFIVCFCGVGLYRIGKVLSPGIPHPVRAPAGTLYTFNRQQALELQEAVDAIGSRLKPGEPLLTKAVPLVNFLTLHPNPTRIDLFVPPSYSPEPQMREVIEVVERERLAWILTPPFVPERNTFDTYLLAHYTLAWNNGEFGLWQRNP